MPVVLIAEDEPLVRMVAVEPEDSAVLSGRPPGPNRIQGIGAGFVPSILDTALIDEIVCIGYDTSLRASQHVARLEGIAPFGKPVFILVATGGRGALALPREDRVLRDAPPDQIVEALAGVRLGPDVLRTAIAGCGLAAGAPSGGQSFTNGWTSIALAEFFPRCRAVARRPPTNPLPSPLS